MSLSGSTTEPRRSLQSSRDSYTSTAESLCVQPETLIAAYGKPRRLPGTRKPCNWLNPIASTMVPSLSTGDIIYVPSLPVSTMVPSLSAGDIRRITQRRPRSVPEMTPVKAPAEIRCAACHIGSCVSRAFPHGPEGYVDHSRCRVGQKTHSQPSCPSDDGSDDDEEDVPPPPNLGFNFKRRTARSSTTIANDFKSLDGIDRGDEEDHEAVVDLAVELLPPPPPPLLKKKEIRRSPFIEFQDKEQIMLAERVWLMEEDGLHMKAKRYDLQSQTVQKIIDMRSKEGTHLYEGKVLYGPESMVMHRKKHSQHIAPVEGWAAESSLRVKPLHQDISLRVKALHQDLDVSSRRVEFVCRDDHKKKKNKGAKTLHHPTGCPESSTCGPTLDVDSGIIAHCALLKGAATAK